MFTFSLAPHVILRILSVVESRCCPGRSKEEFWPVLPTLSWDTAHAVCTLSGICLYWVYIEWHSAYSECTWSETLLILSVHGVRRLCLYWVYYWLLYMGVRLCLYTECTWSKTLFILSAHGVRLCLCWVYVEWDSIYAECTWSETLLTLNLNRVRLCSWRVYKNCTWREILLMLSLFGARLCLRRVYSTWCETLLMLSVHCT